MIHYIDKDALLAEIKRRKNFILSRMIKFYYASNYKEWKAVVNAYNRFISFIKQMKDDTLEVKDVNLEKEVCDWYNNRYKPIDKNCDFEKYTGHWLEKSTIIDLAKHFFELGLKAKEE
ncbi:MAG: hypothetical protein J6S67_11545 [Methanobrevibacter sp.]|nr:hypothetical protein [Methanobrevibacter sp.]